MAITSASSLEDIAREYIDCAGYDLTGGGIAMAERFILACRALQARRPSSVTVDGQPVDFDFKAIADQLERAVTWAGANRQAVGGGRTSTRIYDMSRIRG